MTYIKKVIDGDKKVLGSQTVPLVSRSSQG